MHQSKISRFFSKKNPPKEPPAATSTQSATLSTEDKTKFAFNPESAPEYEPPASEPKKRKPREVLPSEPRLKKAKTKLTSMDNQIIDLLAENADKLLLVQKGYKYLAYGEGGRTVAKILHMYFVEGEKDPRLGHCSFPVFNLHKHLQRILNHGFRVGIVKQVETAAAKQFDEAKKSSEIMSREVTAVYTKSTYLDDEYIDGKGSLENQLDGGKYIICLYEMLPKEFALVAVKPSTGEIVYDQFKDSGFQQELETRLLYLPPSEVIVINEFEEALSLKLLKLVNNNLMMMHHSVPDDPLGAWKHILGDDVLELYTINYSPPIQQCFVALLEYLDKLNLLNLMKVHQNITAFQNSRKYMVIPADTLRSLEVFTNSTTNTTTGSLVDILNHTRTSFGYRLFHSWISRPLIEVEDIRERHDAINALSQHNILFESMETFLGRLRNHDLQSLLIKLHYSADSSQPNRISRKEMYQLLNHFNDVFTLVGKFEKTIKSTDFGSSLVKGIFEDILASGNIIEDQLLLIDHAFFDIKEYADAAKKFFKPDTFDSIEEQNEKMRELDVKFDEELTKMKAELKNPKLRYILVNSEEYLIEVRKSKERELPDKYIKINATNTVGRYRTKAVADLWKLMNYHRDRLLQHCEEEFKKFVTSLDSKYIELKKIVHHIATLDALLSLRDASLIQGYVQPKLIPELQIKVKNARNPIIEHLRANYIANDIAIDRASSRVSIITGPNMGGKSSYVKTVALLTIMAQVGCFLPCDSATMGVFDSLFIRMGANDDILQHKSTFMCEMLECKTILLSVTDRSLVILDEIGRGTGTRDGIALAYAILKYLVEHELKPSLLFITHYPSIGILEKEHPGEVANFHMGYKETHSGVQGEMPEIVFLYNLCRGVCDNLYGLNVAKLAGIPKELIASAATVSEELRSEIELSDCLKFAAVVKKFLHDELDIETLFTYLS
ncbi:DNA mismatch repair protein MSH3 [Candida viswanathii]|uniref:DNA mismatch repair protein MSH3 n=1 Tax=Candida viswanathii TaxID=5486 RepID=A0A367XN11_9ASCO|nr:DNA mismatch repair protein MSH3 [Candida viswanathii]